MKITGICLDTGIEYRIQAYKLLSEVRKEMIKQKTVINSSTINAITNEKKRVYELIFRDVTMSAHFDKALKEAIVEEI